MPARERRHFRGTQDISFIIFMGLMTRRCMNGRKIKDLANWAFNFKSGEITHIDHVILNAVDRRFRLTMICRHQPRISCCCKLTEKVSADETRTAKHQNHFTHQPSSMTYSEQAGARPP